MLPMVRSYNAVSNPVFEGGRAQHSATEPQPKEHKKDPPVEAQRSRS